MLLTVEKQDAFIPPETEEEKKHGTTRLTRARSRGLNVKLDFNYFSTPLPLYVGIVLFEDVYSPRCRYSDLEFKERPPSARRTEDLWHPKLCQGATIVMDSGSRFIKVGNAGEEFPR